MTHSWSAQCENAELAAELAAAAQSAGLAVDPSIEATLDPSAGLPLLWLGTAAPAVGDLAALAATAHRTGQPCVLGLLAAGPGPHHQWASSLGLCATWDLEAAVCCAALLEAGGQRAHHASTRGLPTTTLARLPERPGSGDARNGRIELAEAGQLRWVPRTAKGAKSRGVDLGPPVLARQVLRALAAREAATWTSEQAHVPNPDRAQASEVLFGPERRLSDPASKAALRPYGIPTPQEELCTSPSRAASEATRMGFPVRITLASPDLRAWDEPDLRVDGVDNAARVRDVYRQLTALAGERNPAARVLGVTVAQTRLATALLGIRAVPAEEGISWVQLGFADPHGSAAHDETWLAAPCEPTGLEGALLRLRGHALLLPANPRVRAATCEKLATLLNQLHAFLTDFPAEVREVRLHPVAVLLSGELEAREAAVSVTDAYARGL